MKHLNRVSAFFLKFLELLLILLIVLFLAFIVKWRIDHLYLSSMEGKNISFSLVDEYKKTRRELSIRLGREEPMPVQKLAIEEEEAKNTVDFSIPEGSDQDTIGTILLEKGLIADKNAYRELVDEMGLANKFQYGNYEIPKDAKVKEVLTTITGTQLTTYKISIADGANGHEVGQLLQKKGVIESAYAFGEEAKRMNRFHSFVGGDYTIEMPRKVALIIEEMTKAPEITPPSEQ
ncbi:MAG: endolytic transglycosylase MltG [Tissierellia bacterium]|nr:endolytic transglycosylase MltG [Tissierellia bacterium]